MVAKIDKRITIYERDIDVSSFFVSTLTQYIRKSTALFSLLVFIVCHASGQSPTTNGIVIDEISGAPVAEVQVQVKGTQIVTRTDDKGRFVFAGKLPEPLTLLFVRNGVQVERMFEHWHNGEDLGSVRISFESVGPSRDQIYTIQLNDDDDQESGENISGLLSASRDAFESAVAYVFGPMRFRLRGYDSENSVMQLNGLPFNDLEVGSVFWSNWGGLNDVTRNQENHVGLAAMPFAFGGAGGGVALDLRASSQRVQKRVTYSLTNRAYRNRVMATWSTGLMPNGWAVSVSASHRWAEEGYIEGTFYDAYSYFLSVDKKLSDTHALNLVVMGAPAQRGRNGAATAEMYDLAGTHYYNPYWGYQNGEKRNARVANSHQPIALLRHDWAFSENSKLTTAVGFQTGKYASSALDWYNANDPRPDYYRRLPSYIDDPALAERVADLLRSDKSLRQINWDQLYQVNAASVVTIHDVDGIPGNDVSGRQSQYIVEDRRYDNTRFIASTTLEQQLSETVTLQCGAQYSWQRNEDYKVVNDLLGGEFYVNFDKFALQDFPGNTDVLQNDLNHPNQILHEGDVFGYNYDANIRSGGVWGQVMASLPHVDFFGAASLGNTVFWRTGHMRNGKFPNDSYGDSEKKHFLEGGGKAGVTWKINGRNYLSVNGMYLARAPFFRNVMVSPRTRNQFIDDLKTEKVLSAEANYVFRAPYFKARLTGYYTRFLDQALARSFYHDDERSFVNIAMNGIDQEHLGVEGFVEATVSPGLKVHGVASIGQFIYTSRPNAVITQDNNAAVLNETTIYAKNFYVSGTPQSAYTLGVSKQTRYYLSFYLNVNYFDNLWIDYNPVRRTAEAVDLVEEGSPQWNAIIDQEKAAGGFTVDASVYKSFKLDWYKEPVYFTMSFNVTNVLNNEDLVSGGYEQLRYDFTNHDPETFPSRYYYFPGFNYYFNASIRF